MTSERLGGPHPPGQQGDQCPTHVFRVPLGLGGEVLGVRALGLVVDLVALAVLGVPSLDDVHLGVAGVELGVGRPVCPRRSEAARVRDTGVFLRLAAVSWKPQAEQTVNAVLSEPAVVPSPISVGVALNIPSAVKKTPG